MAVTMISYILHFIIFYTATADNLKVLNYQNSAETIVQDLIDNWQSPIGYLESRGYLPNVLQYAPKLNFDRETDPVEAKTGNAIKENDSAVTDNDRLVRSFDEPNSDEMKNMFRRLFSSKKDDTISDEIKSKLDVSWDMNQLVSTALKEAEKCHEKFSMKLTQNAEIDPIVTNEPFDSDIDAEIAQLYPSVLSKKDDVKKKEVKASSPYKKPYHHLVKGFGKILGNHKLGDGYPQALVFSPKAGPEDRTGHTVTC
ncbi:uncharacterized protein LOC117891337 [Drosophila subobscura]|uniref:uncharacterized protein LOC117891337 n=1 Tax=Drosophila subobscura TaxID=7241 RepID=UPI00155AB661|nr:uncharacterized protein LOC117891337 [Drosophila subobscura]